MSTPNSEPGCSRPANKSIESDKGPQETSTESTKISDSGIPQIPQSASATPKTQAELKDLIKKMHENFNKTMFNYFDEATGISNLMSEDTALKDEVPLVSSGTPESAPHSAIDMNDPKETPVGIYSDRKSIENPEHEENSELGNNPKPEENPVPKKKYKKDSEKLLVRPNNSNSRKRSHRDDF